MAKSFEFCDEKNLFKITIAETEESSFEASTVFGDYTYIGTLDLYDIFDYMTITEFQELHRVYPPTIEIGANITLTYNIKFMNLILKFVMEKTNKSNTTKLHPEHQELEDETKFNYSIKFIYTPGAGVVAKYSDEKIKNYIEAYMFECLEHTICIENAEKPWQCKYSSFGAMLADEDMLYNVPLSINTLVSHYHFSNDVMRSVYKTFINFPHCQVFDNIKNNTEHSFGESYYCDEVPRNNYNIYQSLCDGIMSNSITILEISIEKLIYYDIYSTDEYFAKVHGHGAVIHLMENKITDTKHMLRVHFPIYGIPALHTRTYCARTNKYIKSCILWAGGEIL